MVGLPGRECKLVDWRVVAGFPLRTVGQLASDALDLQSQITLNSTLI